MAVALSSLVVFAPPTLLLWLLPLLVVALAIAVAALPGKVVAPMSLAEVEARRRADEIAEQVEQAAATAAGHRDVWLVAHDELDEAWAAFDLAERAARRTTLAGAFPLMSRSRKLGDNADRERYLHHAATQACRKRDISIAQLNDVYAHRGWNPRLHPVVQEAALQQLAREHRYAEYRRAVAHEQATWSVAETAAQTLLGLRAEAAAAVARISAEHSVAGGQKFVDERVTGELSVAA